MFRQKIAEVTNCTCRLIANDKNDFSIFRKTLHAEKSVKNDHKEKYSLKTQAISSGKTDIKNISAKKTLSKFSKLSEDDKISISGNIDSKKKKIDYSKICSPGSYVPRNFDEVQTPSGSLPKNESNFSNLAYNFRTRNQNKYPDHSTTKVDDSESKTFGALKKFTIAHQNARTILTFFTSSNKNKQNTFKAGNTSQNEKLNERADKSLRKIRNIFENQFPLRQINSNTTYQIVHGSLQKYNKIRDLSNRSKEMENFETNRQSHCNQKNSFVNLSNLKIADQAISHTNRDNSERQQEKLLTTQKNFTRGQYSQSEQFKNFLNNMRSNQVEKVSNQIQTSRVSQINNKIQAQKKLHTFNDLMGQKKLSESILSDEEENENQNSIVVMTFKELIEKNKGQKEKEKGQNDINKLSFIKQKDSNELDKQSIVTNESDLLTKLKPYTGFKQSNGLL